MIDKHDKNYIIAVAVQVATQNYLPQFLLVYNASLHKNRHYVTSYAILYIRLSLYSGVLAAVTILTYI